MWYLFWQKIGVIGYFYVFFHAEQEYEIRFSLSQIIARFTGILCFNVLAKIAQLRPHTRFVI